MRLVMKTLPNSEKCRLCLKIETKQRNIKKEEERIRRWRHESGRSASIEKSEGIVYQLEQDIYKLGAEVYARKKSLN